MGKRITSIALTGDAYRFVKLFEVNWYHDFFASRLCPQLRFTPDKASEMLVKRLGLLVKPMHGRLAILAPSDQSGRPDVVLNQKQVFRFLVSVSDPVFHLFTALDPLPKKGEMIRFYTKGNSRRIYDQTVIVKPQVFMYSFRGTSGPGTLEVRNNKGLVCKRYTTQYISGVHECSIDLSDMPEEIYSIQLKVNGKQVDLQEVLIHEEARRKGAFAIVDIPAKLITMGKTASLFNLYFRAKTTQWKYEVILQKDYKGWKFYLEDATNYKEPDAGYGGVYKLVRFKDRTSSKVRSSMKKGQVLRFESGYSSRVQKIPFFEFPLKNLQLRYHKGDDVRVLKNLPNPSVENLRSEVTLYV